MNRLELAARITLRRLFYSGSLALLLVAAAAAYYLVVSRPAHDRAVLAVLKRERDSVALAGRIARESVRRTELRECLIEADLDAWQAVRATEGTKQKRGVVTASRSVWEEHELRRRFAVEVCAVQYGR